MKKLYTKYFLPFLSILLIAFAFSSSRNITFNADILHILDQDDLSNTLSYINKEYEKRLSQKLTITINSNELNKSLHIAKKIHQDFDKKEFISNDSDDFSPDSFAKIGHYISNNYPYLISKEKIKELKEQPRDSLIADSLKEIYSPFGVASSLIDKDPFFLTNSILKANKSLLKFSIKENELITKNEKNVVILKKINLEKSNEIYNYLLEMKQNQLEKNTEIYFSSLMFYKNHAKDQAKKEAINLTLISLFIIIGFFVYILKTPTPIIIGILHIISSISIGLITVFFIYPEVHLISLLLGISIIGLIADHYIHFIVKKYDSSIKNSKEALESIKMPMFLSYLTTIIGLSTFLFAPYSIFKQFAFFCAFTLSSSLFLLFTITKNYYEEANHSKKVFTFSDKIIKHHYLISKLSPFALLVFSCLFLILISFKNGPNDIRSLDKSNNLLRTMENKITEVLEFNPSFKYFITQGDSPEDLLQNEEIIRSTLAKTKLSYTSLSSWLPSQSQQKLSFESFKSLKGSAKKLYLAIGAKFESKIFDQFFSPIDINRFLKTAPIPFIKDLYIGQYNNSYYSIMPIIEGVVTQSTLNETITNKVIYVDRIEILNKTLNTLKHDFSLVLLYLFLATALFITFKYQFKAMLKIVAPPFFASLFAMTIALTIVNPLNIFHLLGALLVFVMGIDYCFFFFFSKRDDLATYLGIFLSCLTTILSFGLLSISDNTGVSSFGQVVSLGIFMAFILCPLSKRSQQ